MHNAPNRQERITAVLAHAFQPVELVVEDDSARHAGHAGAAEGGQTHYNLRLISPVFAGLSRVQRQRAVMDALKDEFATGLHALSMRLYTEAEVQVS